MLCGVKCAKEKVSKKNIKATRTISGKRNKKQTKDWTLNKILYVEKKRKLSTAWTDSQNVCLSANKQNRYP